METQMAAGRASANDGGASAFIEKSMPTLEEVRAFVRAQNLRVDADRFFETNALRGWTDKDGRPIHDWRRYLLAWAQYETPATPEPPVTKTAERPARSIEEIMEFCLCSREVAEEMVRDGADIIDVGGESTRPGFEKISDEEETERVAPVIEALTARLDVPVSVDTYKSRVAKAALSAGASLINDIWGFKADRNMASVAAETGAACCLMHNRERADYQDFLKDMIADLWECVELARKAGVADDRIILDPGVGFGKNYHLNLQTIAHLDEVRRMGFPVLLGTSRKSVIGTALDLPTDQRLEGTLVTTVYGVQQGCAFLRVHDVKENKRAVQMTKAIMEWR